MSQSSTSTDDVVVTDERREGEMEKKVEGGGGVGKEEKEGRKQEEEREEKKDGKGEGEKEEKKDEEGSGEGGKEETCRTDEMERESLGKKETSEGSRKNKTGDEWEVLCDDSGGLGVANGGRERKVVKRKEVRRLLDLESSIDTREVSEKDGEMREDTRDLKVTIAERKKQTIKNDSFIMYKIDTESTRPSHLYEDSHYQVWRRYKDFEWLQAQIERNHPTLILPPLPGKQVARYFDHKSETFLEERQKVLEKFLCRVAFHPIFSFTSDLKAFLTATSEEFSAYVQESSKGHKLLGKVSMSVKQATTALMLKDVDPEFMKGSKYFTELGEKMGVLERITTHLHGEREMLQMAQDDFSVCLFQWATNEQVMTQPLQGVAKCLEKSNHALKDLNKANTYFLLVAVKEYQLYSTSAVAAIRRRDVLQLEKDRLVDSWDKKKLSHKEASDAGKVQKESKLAADLEKVELSAKQATEQLSRANEQLRVDVKQWHEAKNKEVSQFMRQFAANHIDYHQKCFNEWEQVLRQLRKATPSPVPPDVKSSLSLSQNLNSNNS